MIGTVIVKSIDNYSGESLHDRYEHVRTNVLKKKTKLGVKKAARKIVNNRVEY